MTRRRLGILDNFLLFIIPTFFFFCFPLSSPLSYHFFVLSQFTRFTRQSQNTPPTPPTTPKSVKTHQLFIKKLLDETAAAQLDQQNGAHLRVSPQLCDGTKLPAPVGGEECIPELSAMPGRVVRVARVVIKHFDLVTRCLLNYEWL